MSKYVSKQNLNTIVQEMGKKIPSILNLTNEELQEIIDAFNPEFVPEDEDNNTSDGIPLAAIIPWDSGSNIIPPGFLECNGQAVSRTEYADLFGAIGTKYGSGDGSTTFNVPDYTDGVFLEGSDTAGTSHAAGLPNIEGSTALGVDSASKVYVRETSGAFSAGSTAAIVTVGSAGSNVTKSPDLILDASSFNSIYGASDTVQPKSSTTRYLIKFIPSVPESEASAAASASAAQAAAQAAESYAGSAGIPVGTLFPYAADTLTPPTGFLFCDGSAVSRTMYADLFSVLGTTWGAGDGSTTFNLPTSEDLVLQGASTTNPVGTYKTAGLPNIQGETQFDYAAIDTYVSTGAFQSQLGAGNSRSYSAKSSSAKADVLTFDASQSNSIYGASDTVQPPAACVKFIIKAYDGVTPGSAGIDLSQYASDLSNKADRSLSNLNSTGEARFAHVVVDSYYDSATGDWWRQYADGWIEQGGRIKKGAAAASHTVNLLKPMSDTLYTVIVTGMDTLSMYALGVSSTNTETSFTAAAGGSNYIGLWWSVFGMGA